jgi:uncharacterized Zn finger protein (UPF0148 family)
MTQTSCPKCKVVFNNEEFKFGDKFKCPVCKTEYRIIRFPHQGRWGLVNEEIYKSDWEHLMGKVFD